MGFLIFGAVAMLVVALLVRAAGAGRRLAMELANGEEERGVVAILPVAEVGPAKRKKRSGLPKRAFYLVVKVRVCDVTRATAALKEAPQSHPQLIGGGGDRVRHVLYEVIGRVARKQEEPYDEAAFRAACELKLGERGFELLAYRCAADVAYDDAARASERAIVEECVHAFDARMQLPVSGLELYLDAVSGLGQWHVRAPSRSHALVRSAALDASDTLMVLPLGKRAYEPMSLAALGPSRRSDADDSAASAG